MSYGFDTLRVLPTVSFVRATVYCICSLSTSLTSCLKVSDKIRIFKLEIEMDFRY